MSAAASSPTVAASRVLACPATGALAITTSVTAYHEIARQKSSPAWTLPRSDPLTFDLPPVRGPYGDVAFDDRPARLRGAHHQLDRIAGAAVGDAERRAARRGGPPASARCRAPAGRTGCAAASTPPRCPAARATASAAPAPGGAGRSPCRRRGRARSTSAGSSRGIQRSVGVDDRDDRRRRRLHAGMHRRAVAGATFGDHLGAVPAGHLGGVVGAVVVDHQRPVPVRHGRQHARQRRGLVETGQHHRHRTVGHNNRR